MDATVVITVALIIFRLDDGVVTVGVVFVVRFIAARDVAVNSSID
jgi:hypothetical protein